jgi:TM2 domain-containing membrane protein YozV
MPRSAVTVPAGSTVLPSNAGPQLEPSSARSGYAGPPVIVVRSGKSAGLAAVLSFLWCGLGQIYNGQIGKGVALIVAYVVSWFLLFVLIGFLTTPALWIYGMVDAYRTAERLNREAGLPY